MKIIFIIPYFGKFPNYFSLFLKSCEISKYCDFLLITDNKEEKSFPINFKKIDMTLSEFHMLMEKKLDKKVYLNKPYKLCDYKPMYGYLFEEKIIGYDYWGYCDVDLIFGDLDSFLVPILEKKYDKIFDLGHCTLIKNTYENNSLFLKSAYLNDILQHEKIFIFDEQYNNSINNLFIENNKSIFSKQLAADIFIYGQWFYRTIYNHDAEKFDVDKSKSLFLYSNGKILNYKVNGNQLIKKEFLYIHLQQRKMEVVNSNMNYFKIIPNKFCDVEVENITLENFNKIYLGFFNIQKIIMKFRRIKVAIKRRLK